MQWEPSRVAGRQHEYDHLDGILAIQRAIDNKSLRINRQNLAAIRVLRAIGWYIYIGCEIKEVEVLPRTCFSGFRGKNKNRLSIDLYRVVEFITE